MVDRSSFFVFGVNNSSQLHLVEFVSRLRRFEVGDVLKGAVEGVNGCLHDISYGPK